MRGYSAAAAVATDFAADSAMVNRDLDGHMQRLVFKVAAGEKHAAADLRVATLRAKLVKSGRLDFLAGPSARTRRAVWAAA